MQFNKIKFSLKKKIVTNINVDALPPYLSAHLVNNEKNKVKVISNKELFITPHSPSSKPIIKIDHVIKSFGKNDVLKDVNFVINQGEHLALLGSNGAGKTTLLNIIVGLLKPTSGTVEYLYEYKNSNLEEIGMQFQDSSYPKGITAKNVIDFMLEVYKSNIDKNELDAIIEIFGITKFLNKSASALSGGQQQRINAMLAIVHKPKIAFLDELSTGLDILSKKKITQFILDFCNANGMTLCIVSHDLLEIDYFSKRVVLLDDGKVIVDANKQEIMSKFGSLEKFINLYIH